MKDAEDSVPSCCAWLAYFLILMGVIVAAMVVHFGRASARELGQWNKSGPALRERYQPVILLDVPTTSYLADYAQPGGD